MTTSKASAQISSIDKSLSTAVCAVSVETIEAVRPGEEKAIEGTTDIVRPGDATLDCRPGDDGEERCGEWG